MPWNYLAAEAVLRVTERGRFAVSAVLRANLRRPEILDPSHSGEEIDRVRSFFSARMVGQTDAIESFAAAYELCLSGLLPARRPVASFLLLGPTGVGKTLFVETAAEALSGDAKPGPIKINCAEYGHDHEVAKLIGSPPGYMGHRETSGRLCSDELNKHRDKKTGLTLVLFDEIEKAHPAFWDLLLGILDRAEMSTGENRTVDFSKTMLFMTSNLGSDEIAKLMAGRSLGFLGASTGTMDAAATKAARGRFRPEFYARIDRTVVFHPLSDADKMRIVQMEIDRAAGRIAERGVLLETKPALAEHILGLATDATSGARNIRRTVERILVEPLAALLASGQVRSGDQVLAKLSRGEVRFWKVAGCGM